MKEVKTPELKKLAKVAPDSQKIGEFLEWLSSKEIVLADWDDRDGELFQIDQTREQLLACYFCIDLVKAEKERHAILDDIRAKNRG